LKFLQIDQENLEAILELFEKAVDKEGFIIYKKSGQKVECPYSNRPIPVRDFSILPGSAIFVNNDAYCFAQYRIKHPK